MSGQVTLYKVSEDRKKKKRGQNVMNVRSQIIVLKRYPILTTLTVPFKHINLNNINFKRILKYLVI